MKRNPPWAQHRIPGSLMDSKQMTLHESNIFPYRGKNLEIWLISAGNAIIILTSHISIHFQSFYPYGNISCSSSVTLLVTEEKQRSLISQCKRLLDPPQTTIRQLAYIIGVMTSMKPEHLDRGCLGKQEMALHINCKELLAVWLGLQCQSEKHMFISNRQYSGCM